ncbi:MAG: DUF721 domain-containing protein [Alphaproteobacteria bacterium]|nr:DUF721 domain-containing protein [Alphaproteobacteria bacterium]MBQ9235689.1 DUF721 domain-containing protein [Alphaproteobacteria bacterium]
MKKTEKETKDIISRDRRLGDLQNMDAVLGPLARKLLGKKAFVEADVIYDWKIIIGDELAEFTHPLGIKFNRDERKGGVLNIEAASGAIALEVQAKSKVIIARVNSYFGYEAVDKLKIVQNLNLARIAKQPTDNSEKKLVSANQENYIRQQVEGIENPELAETLARLGRSLFGNN